MATTVNVNLLKSYMVKAGYTQKELAKSLGISEQTLTRKLKKRTLTQMYVAWGMTTT